MSSAQQIYKFLASSKQTRHLLQRVAQHRQLTTILQASLPSPLANFCLAGELVGPTFTVVTTSPVWAAKLRYLLPTLLKTLQGQKAFSQVTEIKIKISNHTTNTNVSPQTRKGAEMSPQSARVIEQTAQTVADPALRESLLRLSNRGKKPENSEN